MNKERESISDFGLAAASTERLRGLCLNVDASIEPRSAERASLSQR